MGLIEIETDRGLPVILPDGTELPGRGPVIIVGPNGSGKTKLSRELRSKDDHSLEFINALRNTRMSQNLPAMSKVQALQQHEGVRESARRRPWELASDFDYVLSQLLADDGDAARSYRHAHKAGQNVTTIEPTALELVENLWGKIFPGRSLEWKDWSPVVHNEQRTATYSANEMSDGERAALYLLGKVLLAAPKTIIVIDEPETHFHSQLAVRLWDELEVVRPDLRFVYVTHDLVFGLSREPAQFLLADPMIGLTRVSVDQRLPAEMRREILGAASFSYYASRIIFCEGTEHSYDGTFLSAWFSQRDTIVVPVGNADAVRECVNAFSAAKVLDNLEALGIIDRDYYSDEQLAAVGTAIHVLPTHEIEAVVCLPGVAEAIASHLARELPKPVEEIIRERLGAEEECRVAHERAKQRIMNAVEDAFSTRPAEWTPSDVQSHFERASSIAAQAGAAATAFSDELERVSAVRCAGSVLELLAVFPSKPLAAGIANSLKTQVSALFDLVNTALRASPGEALYALGQKLEPELAVLGLPERRVAERSTITEST